jgi:hypothetical protein
MRPLMLHFLVLMNIALFRALVVLRLQLTPRGRQRGISILVTAGWMSPRSPKHERVAHCTVRQQGMLSGCLLFCFSRPPHTVGLMWLRLSLRDGLVLLRVRLLRRR